MMHPLSLVIGFLLDLWFGDPRFLPHPICLIGSGISKGEAWVRARCGKTKKGEYLGGMILSLGVILTAFVVAAVVIKLAFFIHFWVGIGVESFLCYQILATKSLKTESMKVYTALKKEGVAQGRRAVSMIVGRDTEALDEKGIIKATIETIAENTSDGVVAPMLFIAIGGVPFGFLYKAINTLDSMIGYKNDKYLYFGRYGAKLDDIVNFIPSRICGVTMIAATFFVGLDVKNALYVYKRDRKNHASPNSAQTESVAAGALNIQLAGDSIYFGKVCKKPYIGDGNREINCEDIIKTNKLLYGTAMIVWLCCVIALVASRGGMI